MKEKNCTWHFGNHAGRAEGVSNAMAQNFKEKPYRSLVRESIQNSMDVVDDPSQPVRVEFAFEKLIRKDFRNLCGISEHIEGCKEYYKNDKKAVKHFDEMLSNIPSDDYTGILDYIRVSDFNTKGMEYIDDFHTDLPFFAFVRAAGVSVKAEEFSGGSYGFGKAAYYQISPLSCVIVSTKTKAGNFFFEGASALVTHLHNGEIKASVGYYDNNDGNPVTEMNDVPDCFKRTETGTDISIIGMRWRRNKDDVKKEIVDEVLKNFWYAILNRKLVVKVQDVEIDADSMMALMSDYYPEKDDISKNAVKYNPRPYYEAVVIAGNDETHKHFKGSLNTLGEVDLYVKVDKDAPGKVLFTRQLNMIVYGKYIPASGSVYGLFACEDKKGNKILKQLEDPAHCQWKASLWKDERDRTVEKGQRALAEINDFLKKCFDSIFLIESADETEITGIADYLYVQNENEEMNDMLPGNNAEQSNAFVGVESGEYDDHGSSATTNIVQVTPPQYETPQKQGVVHVLGPGGTGNTQVGPKEGSTTYGEVGVHERKEGKKKKKGKGNSAGDLKKEVPIGDNAAGESHRESLPVRFRVASQRREGQNIYHIIIYCDHTVKDGEIELLLSGEQSDSTPKLKWVNQGVMKDNVISELRFEEGKNVIEVCFADNSVYSIKLSAYENH